MLYIALLHYPVLNKSGKIVTTAIANTDIHDIARIAKTYGIKNFFVVNPLAAQRELAAEIMSHWQEGYGAVFNPARREAFSLVKLKADLDEVKDEIVLQTGFRPRTVVTGANLKGKLLTCAELRNVLKSGDLPCLLIFGTGWGLAQEIVEKADYRLEPIRGADDYNHLAVRSAVAIIIDRMMRN